jgi:EmrB/QacA subfamily drug resistance transporter
MDRGGHTDLFWQEHDRRRSMAPHTNTERRKRAWVVALTGIGSMMVALDTVVVATALSTIRVDLHASVGQLEWTVNAYNLSFAVLLMTGAALGDRFGRRRLFATGIGLFSVASAACALSPDASFLIAARAVQGAGAALTLPLALALLTAAFPAEKRGAAIGLFSAVTGIAVALGPIVGGAIAQGIAWQWIFWVNVPIGALTLPLILRRIDESYGRKVGLDFPGVALITVAALGIVWGLVRGNSSGWGSAEVVGSLAAGIASAVGFVRWELRAREPMLPMSFFRSRTFTAGNTAIFFVLGSLFSDVFFFPQLLQIGLHYDPLQAGLRLMVWTGTFILVAPGVGALVDRIGERPLMVSGLLIQCGGTAWIAAIARPGLPFSHLVVPLIVAGVGISMAIPSAQNSVVGSATLETAGKLAGINSMMRELGGVFGIAVAVAVFAGFGGYATAGTFVDGFGPAIAVSSGLALLGALCGLALPSRRRREVITLRPAATPGIETVEEAA